jgi:exopolysaccharide production protein ExoZ
VVGSESSLKRSYTGLDLVRLAAALGVTLYHYTFLWWLPSSPDTRPALVLLFRWGWVGVQVFFVLSGFLIAYSANGKSAWGFFTGRLWRLYPTAWICAAITLVATRLGTTGALPDFLRAAAIFPTGPWISAVYWTLAIELAFYVLIAATLAMGVKLRTVAILLGLASCAFWLSRGVAYVAGFHLSPDLLDGQYASMTLLPHGCFFALGMGLWALKQSRDWKMLALVGACIAAGVGEIVEVREHFVSAWGASHPWEAPALWLIALAAIGASIRWDGALRSIARPARVAALMTYPLYLIHDEVGRALMLAVMGLGPVAALLIATVAMIALSLAIVEGEGYLRAAAKSRLGQRPRRLPAADLP